MGHNVASLKLGNNTQGRLCELSLQCRVLAIPECAAIV